MENSQHALSELSPGAKTLLDKCEKANEKRLNAEERKDQLAAARELAVFQHELCLKLLGENLLRRHLAHKHIADEQERPVKRAKDR